MNSFFRNFSRLLVGAVFIFSGFVKGVDPLGFAYKLDDYFIAFGIEWASIFSLFLAICLCALEFSIGVMLLTNVKMKITSWILLLLMGFFTLLTLNDAIFEPVPDCGCFGDAIILTNWETFYKNIFLDIFTLIIFVNRKKFQSPLSCKTQWILIFVYYICFCLFSIYNYRHLPLIDFRAYKIGNKLETHNTDNAVIYLTFKNKETGEQKEYLSNDYPWNDSVWSAQWEFVDQRTAITDQVLSHEFAAEDFDGNDVTEMILTSPKTFIFFSYDLEKVTENEFSKIKELTSEFNKRGIDYILLTASTLESIEEITKVHPYFDYIYTADDIMLKTFIRANPGLVLINEGTIINKWHFNDFPQEADLDSLLDF